MDKQADRYFDFSDDEWLQAEFNPDDVHDLALKIYGAQLQKHLRLANPIAGIKGILALQHCMLALMDGLYAFEARFGTQKQITDSIETVMSFLSKSD